MKLIAAWGIVAAVTVASATSCSIHHESNQFECKVEMDCHDGRVCSDGYCIVGPGPVDAPRLSDAPGGADARECPARCSSCEPGAMKCKIDCAVTRCNGSAVVCPPGWNCEVLCSTPNSCRSGVDCANTLSCDVQCTGAQACRNVSCGTGRCNVNCAGNGACRGVQCGASCACDVTCVNGALCDPVACTALQCGLLQSGCASTEIGCDTCP